ncbi:MAG: hypothetical protein US76_03235 [Parcubacteria group bacterium GW2011_GWA2_38_13b]|nr:MAG: hypothetical protein US76_03235 [Parcubacteria group bacterium GW2011_GWA2_38_13b]
MKIACIGEKWPDPPVMSLKTFKCKRCFTLNQTTKCLCGHPFFIEELLPREEYCKKFGHVRFSPPVKTIQNADTYTKICRCLGCGEEFKCDPPTE